MVNNMKHLIAIFLLMVLAACGGDPTNDTTAAESTAEGAASTSDISIVDGVKRKTVEGFGGVEYESCCWAFRTVFRRYLSGTRTTNAIFFQLEFKGLAGVGRSTVDFLERSIPGYENDF